MDKLLTLIKNNSKKITIVGILIIILVILIVLTIAIIKENEKQKYVVYNGKNLSESKYPGYKEKIDELKKNHPNWTFTLLYTKLDWQEVIKNEGHIDNTKYPLNLIPDSSKYPEDWKCEVDKDKTFDNGTWLCASDKAIKYIDFKIECLKKDKDLSNMEDLITYVKEVINSINGEDDLTKEIILSKISKDYAIDIDILKSNLKTEVKKDVKKEETQEVRDKKLTKYQKASHKVLYYMLMDSKYINLYKNTLGYFKERIERVLASEIVYYESNNGNIDVADFTTTIMGSEDEYEFLQIILSENGNTSVSDEEFNSCVKAILDIYKKDEIIKVKGLIASELDQTKKEELVKKLIDLKRKCE